MKYEPVFKLPYSNVFITDLLFKVNYRYMNAIATIKNGKWELFIEKEFLDKAAGIVTDEGGMMSHAAIVAREFEIPCVVGTKYGTEVFKDGDIIEVNANNGVVRKL